MKEPILAEALQMFVQICQHRGMPREDIVSADQSRHGWVFARGVGEGWSFTLGAGAARRFAVDTEGSLYNATRTWGLRKVPSWYRIRDDREHLHKRAWARRRRLCPAVGPAGNFYAARTAPRRLIVCEVLDDAFEHFIPELFVAVLNRARRDQMVAALPDLVPAWYFPQGPCSSCVVERPLGIHCEPPSSVGTQCE